MSATKMNCFLQRMLRKSDEEINVEKESERSVESTKSAGSTRSSWMKRLGNYSPSKYKVPGSPSRTNTTKKLDSGGFCGDYVAGTPKKTFQTRTPSSPLEMPDLESIIREFESGFLSPSKHETILDTSKQGNFVKKIVAAFEVKYKTYNDLKSEQESKEFHDNEENRPGHCSFDESSKRRSKIFGSPFKTTQDDRKSFDRSLVAQDSRKNRRDYEETEGNSTVFATPSKSNSSESRSAKKSGIFSSPFAMVRSSTRYDEVESELYKTPVGPRCEKDLKDASFEGSKLFELENEPGNRRSGVFFEMFDDERVLETTDLNGTLPIPEETILLESSVLDETTIETISDVSRNTGTILQPSGTDKTPKIVGAFLKKPIEVEDTSIDWIPITGKKLPRKRSLKKLLSSLTGKKSSDKKNKVLFSSQRNLNDESRELQDSGYDEKSCSSSSLTSLVSITEVLLQQENSYVEPERRIALRSFRSRNSLDEEDEDEAFCDSYPNIESKKKILLTEVRREDVKLDLGPSYPSSREVVTMSLDRRTIAKPKIQYLPPQFPPLSRVPKHPHISKIPKHPYVSLTKMDGLPESQEPESPPICIKNDLYEVEFHRSFDDLRPSSFSRESSPTMSDYDVPRRFISRSESGIPAACASILDKSGNETIYDVPRSSIFERPKSSVYEDALSLKRRNARSVTTCFPDYYAFSGDNEPHYATVKPRSKKIYLSRELLDSNSYASSMTKRSSF